MFKITYQDVNELKKGLRAIKELIDFIDALWFLKRYRAVKHVRMTLFTLYDVLKTVLDAMEFEQDEEKGGE